MEDKRPYYIGIDLGTSSVGWAVTDEDYNILKYKKKNLWGARLFEEGKTAQPRREKRSLRRRLKRRVHRIKLLQDIFKDEIAKVDNKFFLRLNESKYYKEDKDESLLTDDTLFADVNYNDKDYHKEYPTIFHLRKDLMESDDKKDIRLIYLALHHIIKNRGNFLHEGNIENITNFKESFEKLNEYLKDNDYPIFNAESFDKIKKIMINKKLIKNDKLENIKNNKQIIEILNGILGLDINLKILLNDDKLPEELEIKENEDSKKNKKIKLSKINLIKDYDNLRSKIEPILNERIELIDRIKGLYDWSIINEILKDSSTLSEYRVKLYEEHKDDLKNLKHLIKIYGSENRIEYLRAFKDSKEKDNYVNYIGLNKKGNKKEVVDKISVAADPLEKVNKYFENLLEECRRKKEKDKELYDKIEQKDKELYNNIIKKLKESNCLKKIRTNVNGAIPYQLHKNELKKIIEKASKYYPFFNEKDENGYVTKNKIIKIMEFKIPYYVGPLNPYHKDISGHAWIEKNSNEKILPWNFEDVVDKTKTAEKFIIRMTNKCTYLLGEDVLPKESILYQKFMVLNELNNMKINNKKLNLNDKNKILQLLFKDKNQKVTKNKIKNFFLLKEDDIITGIDNEFKSNLNSYIEFKNLFSDKNIEENPYNEMVEDIIKYKTIYKDNDLVFKTFSKINKKYSEYLQKKLKEKPEVEKNIKKMNFSGFGNLSKKLLLEISGSNRKTGEFFNSIIEALENTNDNLEQILSNTYTFMSSIEKINKGEDDKELNYHNIMNERYISPSVKKSTWQAIKLIEEIIKIRGYLPKKMFIETTRGINNVNINNQSRKKELESIVKDFNLDDKFLKINSKISNRLYLYYKQLGRCMYSNEMIDINRLSIDYDIDHIYPKSLTKDDSLDNLVLVKKANNARKSNAYPLEEKIRNNEANKIHWKTLRDKKLISEEKYYRLTRNSELTSEELKSFISRQLVETSQSIKILKDIIEEYYNSIDVYMVKVKISKELRNALKLKKIREINNFHHAHDAYLSIISGDVYSRKFNYIYLYSNKDDDIFQRKYDLDDFFEKSIFVGKNEIWNNKNLDKIRKIIRTNNILITRQLKEKNGQLYDENPKRKGKTLSLIPLNLHKLHDTSKYGGYNSLRVSHFFIVKYKDKKNEKIVIENIPILYKKSLKTKEKLEDYCKNILQYDEPKILLSHLKLNSKIKYNNHFYYITGKDDDSRITINNNLELILTEDIENKIHIILSYIEKYKMFEEEKNQMEKIKNYIKTEDYTKILKEKEDYTKIYYVNKNRNYITNDDFDFVYQALLEKIKNSQFKNLLIVNYEKKKLYENKEKIINSYEYFQNLEMISKAKIIQGILNILHTSYCQKVKLEELNISDFRYRIKKNITKEKLYIYNESVTGVFEKKIRINQGINNGVENCCSY